jgi:hypothetical protein
VIPNQPDNKFGIRFIKKMLFAKCASVYGAEFRVITASAFADIVIERGNE